MRMFLNASFYMLYNVCRCCCSSVTMGGGSSVASNGRSVVLDGYYVTGSVKTHVVPEWQKNYHGWLFLKYDCGVRQSISYYRKRAWLLRDWANVCKSRELEEVPYIQPHLVRMPQEPKLPRTPPPQVYYCDCRPRCSPVYPSFCCEAGVWYYDL